MILKLFLLSLLSLPFCFSTPVSSSYAEFCHSAVEDPVIFSQFRRHPFYLGAKENKEWFEGEEYLEILLQDYPHLLEKSDSLFEVDAVGDPLLHYYEEIGWVSPMTLAHAKMVGDLQKEFGDLKEKRILDIGGSCGELCNLLHHLGGFASYTIVDSPQANALTSKYLSYFNVPNVHYLSEKPDLEKEGYDLVVSRLFFSGLSSQDQLQWLHLVFAKIDRGYLISSRSLRGDSLACEDLAWSLQTTQKAISIEKELPFSTSTDRVISWKPRRKKLCE